MHLFLRSNLNFLHISLWITLPTQSCLVSYSFCANLLHLLIMWLLVSVLSLHNLHLLFCCVLSILALIGLVLMALFCAAIRRAYVSLLKFLFLSNVHVLSCEMLFKTSIELLFFPLLFPSYCHSVVHRVIIIVSDGYNESSIVFFLYCLRVVVSMRQGCFQCWRVLFLPLFLKYNLSTLSLGCNAFCIVNSLLFLLIHLFVSGSLQKRILISNECTAQVFIPSIRFLPETFVTSIFIVLLRYSFWILPFVSLFWWCQSPRCPSICRIRFLRSF